MTKIVITLYDRFLLAETALATLKEWALECDELTELIICVDYAHNNLERDRVFNLVSNFTIDNSKVNVTKFLPSNNLGAKVIMTTIWNTSICEKECDFVWIEDDIEFKAKDLNSMISLIRNHCSENSPIICAYDFGGDLIVGHRYQGVLWFWGGSGRYHKALDLTLSNISILQNLSKFTDDWFIYLYWAIIGFRLRYLRLHHWDYALMFHLWNDGKQVYWQSIRGVKNVGFNSKGTHTQRYKPLSYIKDAHATDVDIFYSYAAIRRTRLSRTFFIIKMVIKTFLNLFSNRA